MATYKRLIRCNCRRGVKQFFTFKGWPWETKKERNEELTQRKKEDARSKAKHLFRHRLLRKGKSILQAIPEEARAPTYTTAPSQPLTFTLGSSLF